LSCRNAIIISRPWTTFAESSSNCFASSSILRTALLLLLFSGCSLASQNHPYCDFKIKIIKWLIALLGHWPTKSQNITVTCHILKTIWPASVGSANRPPIRWPLVGHSLSLEMLEPGCRQFRIADRMLDVAMAEIGLAVPGTSAFAKAMRCAAYLRAWWRSASRLDWLAAKDFRSMRA
jgi:hypothetical protein